MIPLLDISPLEGFSAQTPQARPGLIILPRVSVPRAASHNPAATAMAEPELDPPQGKSPLGFTPKPPRWE